MGTITNIIQTLFTSSGAGGTQGDLERLSRAQTRLGQSSASAGRQFSAQASGLGGLVAAYAGAAATSFALQAAFSALSNAARSLQTIDGLTSLAANSGLAGQEILKNVQNITKGQLSLVESAQQINLALSAGFNQDQIEGLSEVALKASRALGRDLSDAMTRVTRGSAKMETELLDELGIYTKIDPATRAYAAAIGKTVSQLSEYERRQAFVNSVIAEGQRKFASINTTVPSAAEKIEAFGKRIIDLATQLGAFLAETLAPLADFFTNNLGAAIGAFGILGSLILGKTLSVLSAKIKGFQTGVENMAAKTNQRLLNLTKASAAAQVAAQNAVAATNMRNKGLAGIGSELKGLKDVAAQRKLNAQELQKTQQLLTKRETNLKAFRQQEIRDIVAARQARAAAATAGDRALALQQLAGASARLQTTNKLLGETRNQLQLVGAAGNSAFAALATRASRAILAVGALTAAVARLAVGIVGLGGFILSAGALFSILGSSIANAIGKGDEFNAWIKGAGQLIKGFFGSQAVRDTKNVLQGITAGSLDNIQQANAQLRGLDTFKFKQKKVYGITIEIEKTKEDLVKEVSSLLTEVSTQTQKTIKSTVTEGGFWASVGASAVSGAVSGITAGFFTGPASPWTSTVLGTIGLVGGAVAGGLTYLWSNVGDEAVSVSEESAKTIDTIYRGTLNNIANNYGAKTADSIEKALGVLEDRYGASSKIDPVAKAYLMAQRQLVIESAKYLDNIYEIASVMAATGKSADQIVKMFDTTKISNRFSKLVAELRGVGNVPISIELKVINRDQIQSMLEKDFVVDMVPTSLDNTLNAYEDLIDPAEFDNMLKLFRKGIASGKTYREAMRGVYDAYADGNPNLASYTYALSRLNTTTLEAIDSTGILGKKVFNFAQSFSEAITIGDGINAILFRTTTALTETGEAVRNGAIDYEQFSQSTSNIGKALSEASRELPAFEAAITRVRSELAQAVAAKVPTAELDQYRAIIALMEQQKAAAEKTLKIEKESLAVLKQREGALKTQIELDSFLKDVTPKNKSVFGIELDMFKASAASTAEELAITMGYLNQIVVGTAAARTAMNSFAQAANSAATAANVDSALGPMLTGLTKENAADTAKQINSLYTHSLSASYDAAQNTFYLMDASGRKTIATLTDVVSEAESTFAGTGERAIEAITETAKQALSIAVDSMKNLTAEYNKMVVDMKAELVTLAAEDLVLTLQFKADKEQIYRDIELIKQQSRIDLLQQDVDIVGAKADAGVISKSAAAKEENALQQQILTERRKLLDLEYEFESAAIEERREIARQESENVIQAIEREAQLQRDKIAADLENVNNLISLYEQNITAQQSVNSQFITSFVASMNSFGQALVTAFNSGATAIGKAIASQGKEVSTGMWATIVPPTMTDIKTGYDELRDTFVISAGEALIQIDENAEALINNEKRRFEEKETLLDGEQDKAKANYEANVAALAKQGELEEYNAMKREQAGEKEKKLIEELTGRLASMQSSFDSTISGALMGLNDLIFYGEGTASEIAMNFFKSIQQTLFEETIAKPLSNIISNWLTGGINTLLGGIDILGSPLAGGVGSAANATGDALTKNTMGQAAFTAGSALEGLGSTIMSSTQIAVGQIQSAQQNFATALQGFGTNAQTSAATSGAQMQAGGTQLSTSIVSTGTTVATGTTAAGTVVGAAGTLFTTLLSSFWPILLMLGISALMKKASGGAVQLAAGGSPTSARHRDRVPALLEPGEFVIRKQSARKIGMPALQAMNATGSAGGAGNVFVNVTNEGSPKQAEASSPRFDGEKYVVDIIMRDISNNGPIRRSLRSRGGL